MAGPCGSCTACCRVYAIPAFDKPAGKWCEYCDIGKGCKAYETRPKHECADFECLWLEMNRLGHEPADDLRPDRCKVVFTPTPNKGLISAVTMPGHPDAFRKGAARRLIEGLVRTGKRVVAGPPASTTKIMIDQRGEREIEMSEPDENGMQRSVQS
jgi:hypothetical protein